jgi:hypothetical protein
LILKKVTNQQLLRFLGLYNCKYRSDYTINSYSDVRLERFAFGCGAIGAPSRSVSDMYDLVRTRNKKMLVAMATALLPEKRAAGVMGLYFLDKMGMKLSAEEAELLRLGRGSNIRIMYCSGCTVRESGEMKNLLATQELDALFQWIVRFYDPKNE